MNNSKNTQLADLIKDNNSTTILHEVKKLFCHHYPEDDFQNIGYCFQRVNELFIGKFPGYKECNTEYHNHDHTKEVFLAVARLLDGYNIRNEKLHVNLGRNLILSALFHDTGYIQQNTDNDGTGAKYTMDHVDRSIWFLKKYREDFNINKDDAESMGSLIKATEFSLNFNDIEYTIEEEQICGALLGTADLIGQMSNRIYLEKLLFLYYEFKEARIPGYDTEFDILHKTMGFYEITLERLKEQFHRAYDYIIDHLKERHEIDSNLYMDAIERNINYLYKIIEDETQNFRHKLRRAGVFNEA